MTLHEAVALSLVPNLPSEHLTERLRAGDPALLDLGSRYIDRAQEMLDRAAAASVFALPWNDPRFPAPLLAIADVPPVLWYRGTLDAFDASAVAVVGSRSASAVALEMATTLAADLAALGVTVVSGLARGVDGAAHRGALRTGRTIGVLGSAHDRMYPREHEALACEIAARGLVLSEYPPGTPPLPHHFPRRNRVISGLSRAVVVIEAAEESGSLITAACALEQGREVMAVPGNALSGRNRGSHALIRDGAKIVEGADDIVEELGWTDRTVQGAPRSPSSQSSTSSGDRLLLAMEPGQPYDLDALAGLSGVAAARLLPRLMTLELGGQVRRLEGGRFMRPI